MNLTKLSLITLTTLITSCGKDVTLYVANPYDDQAIKAEQVITGARISALEARINVIESRFDEVIIDFNSELNNLNSTAATLSEVVTENLNIVNMALDNLQQQQVSVIKICASNEYLIKASSGVYAVHMVSNNFGTFLGKLPNEVTYQTTDSIKARFKLVNSEIICL